MNRQVTGFLVRLYEQEPPKTLKKEGSIVHYHLFPDHSVSQESWSWWVKRVIGLTMTLVPQADGSRMKVVAPVRWERGNVHSIARILEDIAPFELHIVCPQDVTEFRVRMDGKQKLWFFVVHEFENGKRVLPLVWDSELDECYNVSAFFPNFEAEDGFGLIVRDDVIVKLKIGGLAEGTVIDYRPNMRLCKTCQRPYDISVNPPKRVWINALWQKLQSNYLPKRGH